MPDWDQWDAEAVELLIPWFEDDHFLSHLFQPHNEHRVVLTKLQNLALVLLNGQWDSRLEAATNAMLHAALAVAFWVFGCRAIFPGRADPGTATAPGRQPPLPDVPSDTSFSPAVLAAMLFVVAFALFGLPVAWQNVLGGFHSQQYWLAGTSFAAIVTLPFARPWRPAWWVGAVSTILALGSMASGFLAAAAVVIVIGWRLLRRQAAIRETWPALLVCAVAITIGALARHEVPWHEEMKAKTVHDFVFSIVHSLEWPWRERHWTALVLWLPWLVLSWQVLRQPADRATVIPQAIVGLGGWVVLQLVATAYARGAGAYYPASRYMDTLTFGAMANALALAWLLRARIEPRRPRQIVLTLFAAAWLFTLGSGVYTLLVDAVRWELGDAKKYYVSAEHHMRRYLATNDPRELTYQQIPFPSAEGLVQRLANPHLRALMPVPIRASLAMSPDGLRSSRATSENEGAFQRNDTVPRESEKLPRHGLSPATPPLDYAATWGSFRGGGNGAAPTGTWTSAPLTATLGGWLKFETAGDIGRPNSGVALTLRDAATGKSLGDVRPSRPPGDSWRAAYVRAPDRPFVVTATDQSAEAWLAFSAPVEMATWSYLAWQATKHGLLILYVSAAATLVLVMVGIAHWRLQTNGAIRTIEEVHAE